MSANHKFIDTVALLGAAGTIDGARRVSGSATGGAGWFNVDVFADQAGTLFIERSPDQGVTWYPCNGTAGTAVALNTSVLIRTPCTTISYRYRYLNGATPQTKFLVSSSFSDS